MHMKRPVLSSCQAEGDGSFVGIAEDSARWPAILEFVSAGQWPDGSKRVVGSIILFVEGHVLKACLNDKDAGAVAFATARSLLELLDVLEGILCNGTGDWRSSKIQRNGRK